MPSDFLAVEFICLILALRRMHISSSIGCRRLDKLDRKQSNVTYVERQKMPLDNVRRQSDARCAPHLGKLQRRQAARATYLVHAVRHRRHGRAHARRGRQGVWCHQGAHSTDRSHGIKEAALSQTCESPILAASTEAERDTVLASLIQQRAKAVIVESDPVFNGMVERLVTLAQTMPFLRCSQDVNSSPPAV